MEDDTHCKDDDDDDDDENNNNERRVDILKSKEQSSVLSSSLMDHINNDDAKTTTTTSSSSPLTSTTTTTMNHITEKVTAVTKIMNTPISSINWIKVIELCYTIPDDMIDYYQHHHYNNNPSKSICDSCGKNEQDVDDVDGVDVVKEPSSSISSNDNTNAITTNNNDTTTTNTTTTTATTTTTIYKVCGQCKVAKYCCRQCQITDWKKQHKHLCQSYQRMKLVSKLTVNATTTTTIQDDDGDDHNADSSDNDAVASAIDIQSSANNNDDNDDHTKHTTTDIQQQHNNNNNKYYWTLKNDEIKTIVRNELFHKIRFYICPYSVLQYQQLGRGLVYIQSNCTLDIISYTKPMYCNGHTINIVRNCTIHYLTLGEYDLEICRNDFEMSIIQKDIHTIVNNIYNPIQQIVIVMKFRCGHVALGIAPLIPDYNICIRLGHDYNYNNNNNMLQLNLDE